MSQNKEESLKTVASINPHFAVPPYAAKQSGGDNDSWYVENKNGVNCLTFGTGQVFTDKEKAKNLAKKWTLEAELGFPPSTNPIRVNT
jgi:hypothetical protein